MEGLSQVVFSFLKLSLLPSSSDHIQHQPKDEHRSREEASGKVCSCSVISLRSEQGTSQHQRRLMVWVSTTAGTPLLTFRRMFSG